MATKEEIFATVAEVLVDSLAVDEEEVTREATLVDDLGAESIDLLEIVFNLEKKFNVKIDRSELIPEDLFTNPEYVVEGKLTPLDSPFSKNVFRTRIWTLSKPILSSRIFPKF